LEFFNCLQNGDVKKAESIVEKNWVRLF
jgi:hypothetical protein